MHLVIYENSLIVCASCILVISTMLNRSALGSFFVYVLYSLFVRITKSIMDSFFIVTNVIQITFFYRYAPKFEN